ncbi:DUF333 domain-containing protein [Comamonas sp. lk]|uniref:putative hemolysin n=1 Tax=Comamonas sp. lk TaxID=2201272 RepID=UPI001F09FC46|nr:DUF333 domain-containing protein [Comamonas sp. lk]
MSTKGMSEPLSFTYMKAFGKEKHRPSKRTARHFQPLYHGGMKHIKPIVTLAAAAGLSACAAPEPAVPALGMANPASVYCVKLGGTSVMESHAAGQVGICHLPDGTQIEEWTLFRRDHPQSGSVR